MSESSALAVVEGKEVAAAENPSHLMRQATDVAGVCREIVMRTAMELQGRRYVRVEGWMSIAAAYGCVPSIREVVEEERGVRAVAELRRHDGTVLASAEGYVGLDEVRWVNQPLYARRGMAQTRAVSRVCRSVFAFVVTLIDGGLQTTPAEEVPHGGDVVDANFSPSASPRPSPPPMGAASAGGPTAAPVRDRSTQVRYGRTKGKHLCDISGEDLEWQLAAARKSVEARDPKWHPQNSAWLATVEAEVARRQSAGA